MGVFKKGVPKKNQFNQSKRVLVKIFFKFFHRFEVSILRICESVVLLNLKIFFKSFYRFEVSILRICESVVLLNLDRNVDYKMM